jgi:hypothetical protein
MVHEIVAARNLVKHACHLFLLGFFGIFERYDGIVRVFGHEAQR